MCWEVCVFLYMFCLPFLVAYWWLNIAKKIHAKNHGEHHGQDLDEIELNTWYFNSQVETPINNEFARVLTRSGQVRIVINGSLGPELIAVD